LLAWRSAVDHARAVATVHLDAIAAAESCDETNGWDMIVVEMDGRNRPRVVYG
jgi:hypothetical protein